MKKVLLNVMKVVIPISLGVILVFWIYRQLGDQDRADLFTSIRQANYFYVLISIILGILSHMSRAYRWKYLLEPLGLRPKFWNSFFSVMIGYGANMLLPRVGEVTRCGMMRRYEKMPFDKLFGTVVAERVADMTLLISLIAIVLLSQFSVLKDQLYGMLQAHNQSASSFPWLWVIIGIIVLVGVSVILFIWKNKTHPISIKVRKLIKGFFDGLLSIVHMRYKWRFIGHTFFIWLMYLGMFYICFKALSDTAHPPFMGVMAAFVMGGLAIVVVPGGIGAYPAAVMATLALYGIAEGVGFALGWIIWTAQTMMIVSTSVMSLLLIPVYNRRPDVSAQK